MAMFENSNAMEGYNLNYLIVAMITLVVTVVVQGYFKAFITHSCVEL